MTTYYIRTDGNDVNTGTINSSSGAWRTIRKGADTVQPGDIVRIQEGTYIEDNIWFTKSGTSTNWITFIGDGIVTIQGTTKNPGNYGLLLLGISYVKFENFTVSIYFVGIRGDSYLGANINNVTLYNIKVTDVLYDGIGFGAYTTNLIIDSVDVGFFGDHGIGIYALNSGELNRYITIKNSKVHDNTGESGQYHNAIDIHTNIWDVTLQNNEIWNIFGSQSAFYVHNWNVKRVTIKDNYIHESDRGMQLIGVSNSLIENNTIENADTYIIAMYQDSPNSDPNNNIIFRNNIMKGTKRWEGCVRIQKFYDNYNTNIIFENNSITGCSNGQSYSLSSANNQNIIIRNQVENNFKIEVALAPPVNSFVEYTDGRTFSVDGVGEYTSYAISSLGVRIIKVVGWTSVGNTSGTVRDTVSGSGIDNVTVTDGTKTTTTDESGNFFLANILTGSRNITASKTGYQTALKLVTVIENSTVITDFQLDPLILPTITSYSPSNLTPFQDEGTTNTFNVTVDQPVTNKWFLDSIQQSSTSQTYTKTWSYTDAGTHNITYSGENANGTASKTWNVTVINVADITPPVITGVGSSSATISGATITWTTNEPATSQVEYGLSTGYGSNTTLNSTLTTSHSVTLTGLTSSTTYHYRVKSKDADNNFANSSNYSFTTLPISTGTAGMWHLDEGIGSIARDSSGNNNNGTIYGAAWTAGKLGSSLMFDGNDYVSIPNSASLNPVSEITIEVWFKPATILKAGWNKIIAKPYTSYVSPYQQYALALNGDKVIFELNTGGTKDAVTSSISLAADTWYHLAGTYNGSVMRIYVNGELNGTLSKSGVIASYPTNVHIGAGIYSGTSTEYINGTIDEVKILSRALSVEEVKTDYEAGNNVCPQPICNLILT